MAAISGFSFDLVGGETTTVDAKGRLILSKEKREFLGPNFFMTRGDRRQIVLMRADMIARIEQQLRDATPSHHFTNYVRHLFAEAQKDVNPDNQGRIVINKDLREGAKLLVPEDEKRREAKVVAIGIQVEIWNKAEYDQYDSNPAAYNAEYAAYVNTAMEGLGLYG